MSDDQPAGMYDLLETLESLIRAAPAEKRQELANVLKSYAESFPDEFYWATGAQAPTLLHHLMMSIDMACTSNDKPRSIGWLAGRKPEGTA